MSVLAEDAVQTLRDEGWAVLRGVVRPAVLTELRDVVEAEFRRLESDQPPSDLPFGANPLLGSRSHGGFSCPLAASFVRAELFAADALHELTRAYLGESYFLFEYVLNAAAPHGDTWQIMHADTEEVSERGPVGLSWVVPLADAGPHEGMTEIVPRSRAAEGEGGEPFQPDLKAGDVLVRDLTLQHRGAPNHGDQWRYLLTAVVMPAWKAMDGENVRSLVSAADWQAFPPVVQWLVRRHVLADASPRAEGYPPIADDEALEELAERLRGSIERARGAGPDAR